jgi:excisionase family DNA binding protein
MTDEQQHDPFEGEARMTVGEAIAYLGISQSKMARLLKNGTLPWRHDALDGRLRLIKRADVERLASMSTRPKSAA